MFHARKSTEGTGLGMYGATLDYKVHSKLYTIPKCCPQFFVPFQPFVLMTQRSFNGMYGWP